MGHTTRDSALQDPDRLAALEDTGLLDTPSEDSIDRFTRLAQRLLGAPLAQLSLVDDRRQFNKSRIGPPDWEHLLVVALVMVRQLVLT